MDQQNPASLPNTHTFYLFRNTATDSKENMQNSNTAEERRNLTKLLMQPYSNWEDYLTPAPLSIAILGELDTDFFINKNPPKDGYKYIRYPDSFRACLMQVCNSGWGAFNEAHKNMDQIRLHTMNVPNYMKTAVKILFQGNDEVVQAHLPDQLENIRVIADECLELSASTEKRFTDVINIIQELLEACANAEHFYGEELKRVERETQTNQTEHVKQKKRASARASQNVWFRVEQSREQLKSTRGSYEKAVENMEKNQKELTEILNSMRNPEFSKINTTTMMLEKGMDAMGRVKQQWEKMMHFFQMMSNILKTCLTRTLEDFVSTSEKIQSLCYNSKLFSKDLLYNQASQASNIASLVHMISATYTDVSEKYLMYQVSSMGKLIMDKEKPEFEQERQQLQNSCDEAQKGILSLVLRNKDEFEMKTNARLEKIDEELLAILPEAEPNDVDLDSGFTEEDEEYC